MAKRGLGKGLGAFFGEEIVQEVAKERSEQKAEQAEKENGNVEENNIDKTEERKTNQVIQQMVNESGEIVIKISKIEPNQEQPRKDFKEEQLQELAESIKQYGILQPLLVQKKQDYYEIIAGERRWRAAKLAGLKEVPVVIREYSQQQAVEISLIENVQREDLNPIEEALAYQRLMQEFHLKQEEIAERVSKNRTTITNSMRLLNLVPEVQQMLIDGLISSGHARTLLAISDPKQQLSLAVRIVEEHLSVREVEKAVKALGKVPKDEKKVNKDEALELIFKSLEDRMKTIMGTKVNINRKDRNKGKIEIEYYSESELERIVELIESVQQESL
ncbi:MAG: ParB/RepB/Spo0J family partition protein [Lachnospiraceae bacterium]|nr:ParB/RepB/Spo0J family partition protein [Lachnospiraceae bacterium]